MIPYTLTETSLNVLFKGRMRTLSSAHVNWHEAVDLVRRMNTEVTTREHEDRLMSILDISTFIALHTHGRVSLNASEVRIDGRVYHNHAAERALSMLRAGHDVYPLLHFIDKLQSNPNEDVREDLWKWLEVGGLPLCADGCFIAFKKVAPDYRSYHAGPEGYKPLHQIGHIVEMARSDCDEDRNQTCSTGLHFCSFPYLSNYAGHDGHVMVLKIDPADVVAIPTDYRLTKGRACRYLVYDEVPHDEAEGVFKGTPVVEVECPREDYDYDTDDHYDEVVDDETEDEAEDETEDETEDEIEDETEDDAAVESDTGYDRMTDVALISLLDVLNGDHASLDTAFDWDQTPQGAVHWANRYYNGGLTEDDIAWLRGLYDYAWFKQTIGSITYSETLTPADTALEEAGALKDALGPTSIVNPLPVDKTPSWVTAMRTDAARSPYESVTDVDTGYLGQALHGELVALWLAFKWASSPQGQHYWDSRANGTETLTTEDRKWLQGLLEYTNRRGGSPS